MELFALPFWQDPRFGMISKIPYRWHFLQIMFGVLLGMEASKKPFSHTHTKYIPLLEKWNLILRIKIVILRTPQLEAMISTEFI